MNKVTKIFLFTLFLYTHHTINTPHLYSQLVSDFKVNDDNTSYPHLAAKLDCDSSGNFVIVWQDERYSASSSFSRIIFGQRYTNLGQPVGINFKINNENDTGGTPSIATKMSGDFIVCWSDGSKYRILMRMFDKDALPLTGAIQVSDSNYSNNNPIVKIDSNGDFVIVWEYYFPNLGERIFFQRFNSKGIKIGSNKNVADSSVNSRKSEPDITVRRDGSFIICWQDDRIDGLNYDIFMQVYDSAGNKLGSNVRVNDDTVSFQGYPKITSDSIGNFCITWFDLRAFPTYLTYCQFYNSNGSKAGNNIFVSTNIPTCIDARPNGDLAIGMNEGSLLKAQRLRSDRTFWGNSFLITDQALSTDKTLTDIKIYKDKLISVWQDRRNGHFDIYCNIRSFSSPDSTTGIVSNSNLIPVEFQLFQNYPNPFNPSTKIPFQINRAGQVTLEIFDVTGRKVKSLINRKLKPAKYEIDFISSDFSGGIFFYVLKWNNFSSTKSMLFLK